jgi:stage II sporulation protein P
LLLRHQLLSGAVVIGLLCGSAPAVHASASTEPPLPVSAASKSSEQSPDAAKKITVHIVDVTNLRKSPSLEAEIIGKARPGQTYPVIASEGSWYRISLGASASAYVASWVVETNEEIIQPPAPTDSPDETSTGGKSSEAPKQETIIHITDVTNLRAGPSLDDKIIGKAAPGQTYTVIAPEGDWYRIALTGGNEAYVAGWVVTAVTASTEQDSKSQVFIYHTHNRESWRNVARNTSGTSFDDSQVNITLVGKELGLALQEKGIPSIASTDDIAGRLNKQNLAYSQSYAESRKIIDQTRITAPSLSYFFDIHRDADVPRGNTTVTIDGKSYARIMFIIGTANPNYVENSKFADQLNELLNKKYPGLSRGVLVKNAHQGNGEYNQSVSPGSILLEFGGVNNTLEENLLTAGAFADVFAEYWTAKQGSSKP